MVPGKIWGILASIVGFSLVIFLISVGIRYFGYPASTVSSTSHSQIKTRIDSRGVIQVLVSAGCFSMGSDSMVMADERPKHEVCLSHDYWIDQYEETNESYQKFVDDGGYMKLQY